MRAEFYRKDEPDRVIGVADWDGSRVSVESGDDHVAGVLWRVFRPTAVAVDDASLRTAGTDGPVVFPPGSLRWFQAAARVRSEPEGMAVRLVPEPRESAGWDPAGAYRPFSDVVERMQRAGRGAGSD